MTTNPNTYLAAADREQQIVTQAITLFAEKGFSLTTRELAFGLKITQPLLYRYFPSKQSLIDRVYDEVFMSRWDPNWAVFLKDRSIPLSERLITYLEDYTKSILSNEWVRIFLYAGLNEPSINQKIIERLHKEAFSIISNEIRHEKNQKGTPSKLQLMLDNEVLWSFHSSFFYMGVRKWVYRTEIPTNISEVIKYKVHAFLHGALN